MTELRVSVGPVAGPPVEEAFLSAKKRCPVAVFPGSNTFDKPFDGCIYLDKTAPIWLEAALRTQREIHSQATRVRTMLMYKISKVGFIYRTLITLSCVTVIGQSASHADVFADLSQDWSNTSNPNTGSYGTWSYNQGSTPLPFINNWAGTTDGLNGWGPSPNVVGDFLPFWFQVTGPTQPTEGYGQDGDVIVHPTSADNSDGNGPANVSWVNPVAGSQSAFISGSFWATPTRSITSRLQDYELILNPGVNQQILIAPTLLNLALYSKNDPLTFSLTENLHQGDVLDLYLLANNGGEGTLIGLNLTVDVTPEPQAYAIGLFFLVMFGVWKFCRRTPRQA
jgi:hypothetical protein